jgi:uncharacterized membrane-anchored protein YitT (DUF2179 family)
MLLIVDGFVVILAMVVYGDIEAGLYAILTLCVCAVIADKGLAGLDRANVCLIVTGKEPGLLACPIMDKMKRGVTNITGAGMFAGHGRNVLIVAVKPRETYKIKEIVAFLDNSAFMMVIHANEVLGNGFKVIMPGRAGDEKVTGSKSAG